MRRRAPPPKIDSHVSRESKQQMLLVRFGAWFLSMGGSTNQAVLFIVVLIEGEYKRRSIIVLARKVIRLRTP